jgi:hypothetical protein
MAWDKRMTLILLLSHLYPWFCFSSALEVAVVDILFNRCVVSMRGPLVIRRELLFLPLGN